MRTKRRIITETSRQAWTPAMNPRPHVVCSRPLCRAVPMLALLTVCAATFAQTRQLHVASMHLPNGLTVLALEDHTVPSVAYWTVFKVGSRNERPGITGLSHLFEHMMFNGSAKFKPKLFDQVV